VVSGINNKETFQVKTEQGLLMNEEGAAREIGVSIKTLQAWRQRGGGPRYVSISRRCVRYRSEDLRAWAESKLVSSTSEAVAK
jgi:predicted DNA-binding transcriptional regulator AlpA